jgi:hypothetical protein
MRRSVINQLINVNQVIDYFLKYILIKDFPHHPLTPLITLNQKENRARRPQPGFILAKEWNKTCARKSKPKASESNTL